MKDLTKGKPSRLILAFALPIFLANLLQLTYSLVDTRIVGSFLGEDALAAVGATSSLSNLIIGFLMGLSNGFAIITAQRFGAKDLRGVKKSFAMSLTLGIAVAAGLTVLGLLFLQPILRFLNVPENLRTVAGSYIVIIIAGLIATFLYDACAAALRALGDTITPLVILAISVILNIAGDLFFVVVLKTGVRGAAVATVSAQIERLYWSVCREINHIVSGLKHAPDEFRNLDKLLADKYFCNFSLFQSLPDSWAIDQIFPIMPIQRLDERPDRTATLQDITCDSDGKIANFVSTRNVSHDLPVHTIKAKESYYIGVFLVGAYQEILGDMHNLFGDTNAVHVTVNEKGYTIDQVIDGETVAEALDYVQYSPKKLVRTLETWVTKSVKEGKISLEEGKEFLANYRSGLYGYTYLE